MKRIFYVVAAFLTACTAPEPTSNEPSLKAAFGDKFLIGVALNQMQISTDTAAQELVKQHFNAIVAENCMKSEVIHPEENVYNFVPADSLVDFGQANGMVVIGHCLIWHSQLASWFAVDSLGNDVAPEVLKARMKEHISTIVGRYRGRIRGWDVVNEAIVEDGSYRQSPFYRILGEEFIPLAFQYANEADPDAELYYNDYGMNVPGRRDGVVRLIKQLKERGLRIDAVGMQAHMGMDYPQLDEFERSLEAFAAEGVNVMMTEWDMSALPTVSRSANISDKMAYERAMNPYPDGLPEDVELEWNARMRDFFELFLRHADVITRVNAWGLTDGDSWKNDFPMKGRVEYPLLFDRKKQLKPFLQEMLNARTATFKPLIYSASGDTTPVNPIVPGCHPDPSICRVGEDYYMVNSSFAFFPAVPIWHSRDLTHWTQIGYVLDRPEQLELKPHLRISGGIYAPDISYNPANGLFYMITTNVDGGGNFFVTCADPKQGNWSRPTYLPDVWGIDPSIIFDGDKAYILNNDAPAGKALYDGHRAIWIREFDWQNGVTVGQAKMIVNGGVKIDEKPVWIEGPHLYHVGEKYYMMAAEGGTGDNHREVIFCADSPMGDYKPCDINPILTQMGIDSGVTCAGHADLVQASDGSWHAVFLGVRPYGNGHDVMGRETFILPVTWTNDQPVILPAGEVIRTAPRLVEPTPLWTSSLAVEAFTIRSPRNKFFSISPNGELVMEARQTKIYAHRTPSAVGRWITENAFEASTAVTFEAQTTKDLAGICLYQNDECNVVFGLSRDENGDRCVRLEARCKGEIVAENTAKIDLANLDLKVEGVENDGRVEYVFSYSADKKTWTSPFAPVSADILSTRTAGGFTGAMVGVYATANY